MTGPLTDAAGPGAGCADLASVVPQVLEPARVSLRISHCHRDGLNRDRRWRERSQTDRGFDRQPAQGPDVFAVGMRHRDALDQPRSPDQHTNRHGLPVLLRAWSLWPVCCCAGPFYWTDRSSFRRRPPPPPRF